MDIKNLKYFKKAVLEDKPQMRCRYSCKMSTKQDISLLMDEARAASQDSEAC